MNENNQNKKCKHCQSDIPKKAKICPVCKKKQSGMLKWILIIIVIIAILGSCSGNGNEDTSSASNDVKENISTEITNNNSVSKDTSVSSETSESREEVVITPQPEIPVEDASSDMTLGQKNALKSAKSYLDFSAFSYEGLVEQLEYEQYSHDDAVFAVDNCGADWNEQALKSAIAYLDFSAFSYEGLIEQLEYEKFSSEQAKYAADNCNADWNEQAAKSAKSYLDFSSFSRDSLIEQLEYEGFTHEQAVYGVEANGY